MKAVHSAFNQAIDSANELFAAAVASPLTITLGDEFQGLLRSLAQAWEVAFDLRLRLLVANVPCRFVIGMTELETPLNTKQAWNIMGARARCRPRQAERQTLRQRLQILVLRRADHRVLAGRGRRLDDARWSSTGQRRSSSTTRRSAGRRGPTRRWRRGVAVTPRSLYKVLHAARAEFHQRQSEVLRGALRGLDERYGLQ